MQDPTRREQVIAGLRELAQFLEDHPDLPVPHGADASPYLNGTDEQDRAEVDRIAAILGKTPVQDTPAHYRVARDFGADVVYRATAITEAHMAEWRAFSDEFHQRQAAQQQASGES